MVLHLIKLCVGVDSIEDLQGWVDRRQAQRRAAGLPPEQFHTTRMTPRRKDDLLDGGSLYWVIRGMVQVRQRLVDIRPFTDDDGINRCKLMLEPKLVPTEWQPRRPFQGWRYLPAKDAPRDLPAGAAGPMPNELRAELARLGLL